MYQTHLYREPERFIHEIAVGRAESESHGIGHHAQNYLKDNFQSETVVLWDIKFSFRKSFIIISFRGSRLDWLGPLYIINRTFAGAPTEVPFL